MKIPFKTTLTHFILKQLGILILCLISLTQVSAQVDDQATRETKELYQYLKETSKKGTAFGYQTPTSMGKGWTSDSSENLKSDMESATGLSPAIYGFDFKKWKFNLDKGWMTDLEQVKEIFRRGGIITYSWHTDNPVTGNNCKDIVQGTLQDILPGGSKHQLFNTWLDKIAEFAHAAKVDDVHAPILFRPFHENTGQWFWWGSQNKPKDYIAAFRYVVDYLKNKRKVHSFLYVYSPSKPISKAHYLKTYPGDDYVDILGFDAYLNPGTEETLDKYARIVAELAREKSKVAAITETGCRNGIQNSDTTKWFSKYLLTDTLKKLEIAYIMTWHNNDKHTWVPPKGTPNYDDFKAFCNTLSTLTLKDLQVEFKKETN